LRGGGLDQCFKLFAGDVWIHPVTEGFFFPVPPRLETFSIQFAG
jgi:hypothetical protein